MSENQLVVDAYSQLYGGVISGETVYSGHFKGYNASIHYTKTFTGEKVTVKASNVWEEVNRDIQIGLIQSLMLRLFAKRKRPLVTRTSSIELYESFSKNLEKFAPVHEIDATLEASFDKNNALYFENQLAKPNLVWGNTTFRKLGSYTYQSDTITMSPILRGNARYLDYVMFHEMLHKKHRYYKTKTGRMAHHHTAFKNDEATYPEVEKINKELQWFVAKQKIKGFLFD